jgi:hypothetical protein
MKGGDASATSYQGLAEAWGGTGFGTADGGDAYANSTQADAEAYGGHSHFADGGAAWALAWLDATAVGGTSLNAVLGAQGGFAQAYTRVSSPGNALANGGDGNIGGNAFAQVEGAGIAVAVGGSGLLDPGLTTSIGGNADASHTSAAGSAVATSGSAHPGAGTGGSAIATNDAGVSNSFTPSNWQGGTVVAP